MRKKNAQAAKTKTAQRSETEAPRRSNDFQKAEQEQLKVLAGFHPTVIDWFKDKLDLDLAKMPANELYRLQRGEFTSPQRIVVTPLAYDTAAKKNVEMPRMVAIVSLRANIPAEKGKAVALDDKHKVFLQTIPCRPLVELAAPGEELAPAPAVKDDRQPTFTKAQVMALEGVGIVPERLFGGFNRLSKAEKLDILDGEIFPVDGCVKTDFGYVNVIGDARMVSSEDGEKVSVNFEPMAPEKRAEGLTVDLERGRVIGTLELDLFKRGADNKIMKDASGAPMLNAEGENLLDFGASLGPVKGYTHKRERDKEGVWKDTVEVADYTVKVLNGCLFAQKMNSEKLVKEEKRSANSSKKVVETRRVKLDAPEVPLVRMNGDKVFVIGETKPLEFRSEADRLSYIQGRGGVVLNASFKDFKTGKVSTYDAFIYPNESGFGQKFTPETTKKILERRERKASMAQRTRRKAHFGRGL